MDVSIIIVNYNTENFVINAIKSIYDKVNDIEYEIIIVDNQSPNGTEKLNTVIGGHTRLITLKENIGFGGANNEGIKESMGRNIFLLNPDTRLINNAVKILSDYIDSHTNVGVCGGNLYDENNEPIHSYMPMLPGIRWEINQLLSWKLWKNRFYDRNFMFNYGKTPISVGYITGADMMIRREVIDKVGDFDKDFFMYYEETELTWRIKKAGYKVMNIPQAQIIHLEGKSQTSINREKAIFKSRNIYYQKTTTLTEQRICNFIYKVYINTRKIAWTIQRNKNKLKILNEVHHE